MRQHSMEVVVGVFDGVGSVAAFHGGNKLWQGDV